MLSLTYCSFLVRVLMKLQMFHASYLDRLRTVDSTGNDCIKEYKFSSFILFNS